MFLGCVKGFPSRIAGLTIIALFILGICTPLVARDAPPFNPSLPAGARCEVAVEKLHPTQFAVGYWEVQQRAAHIASKGPKKLRAYLEEHLALVVVGPGGVPYLVDGHHLAAAMLKSRRGESIQARIEANWRDLPADAFWKKMREHNWVYPYDNQGKGPLDVAKLPQKVAELADDPYRSLAWAVRDQGGFTKTMASFAEFQWANFYRRRVTIGQGPGDFQRAVEAALKISHSPEAKELPGYTP
jgi:hypothetical protein